MMRGIIYHPIGVIHSPFHDITGMPIQPTGRDSAPGTGEVFEQFSQGLKDLEEFSHLILVYHFHCVGSARLTVTPFLDTQPRGVFATRAPARPNPIGLSIVSLVSIEDNILHVQNLDILDGTPLLDIKPYVSEFDHPDAVRTGWYEKARCKVWYKQTDERFKQ